MIEIFVLLAPHILLAFAAAKEFSELSPKVPSAPKFKYPSEEPINDMPPWTMLEFS